MLGLREGPLLSIQRVTVFGGSGFLGRRIVARLLAADLEVRVAVRHPEGAAALPDLAGADVLRADVQDEEAVALAVARAEAVINCVGHYVETGGVGFEAIHGQGAVRVARLAAVAGASRLVLVSGLGADPQSPSPYVRARAQGEALVREAFEAATILRPGVIFGPGDALFTRLAALAQLRLLPLFGSGTTRLQPVFVEDVAEACLRVLARPEAAGGIYELGGPQVYRYRDLVALVLRRLDRRGLLLPLPFRLWDLLAVLASPLPSPPLTRDQVVLMRQDNVLSGRHPGLEELGIVPSGVEEILPRYIGP